MTKKAKQPVPTNMGIVIQGPDKETMQEVGRLVLAILDAKADQQTIREALVVFKDAATPSHTSITNCKFAVGKE